MTDSPLMFVDVDEFRVWHRPDHVKLEPPHPHNSSDLWALKVYTGHSNGFVVWGEKRELEKLRDLLGQLEPKP